MRIGLGQSPSPTWKLVAKLAKPFRIRNCTAPKDPQSFDYSSNDRATVSMTAVDGRNNEIQFYIDVLYVSAAEAAWRIFMLPMHRSHPTVQRLQLHLLNEQVIAFDASEEITNLMAQNHKTTLTQ